MAFDGQHKEDGPKLNALLRLADIVEKKEGQYEHGLFADTKTPTCGTRACMLGWATLEMGPELGLYFVSDPWRHSADVPHFIPQHESQRETAEDDPYAAGAVAFNITQDEAESLFGHDFTSPNTAAEAAAVLRKFVAAKVKEMA